MKKTFSLYILIASLLFLTGCAGVNLSETSEDEIINQISEKVSEEDLEKITDAVIACDAPYIRHGAGCCLDENENSICDSDESIDEETNENYDEDSDHPKEEKKDQDVSIEFKKTSDTTFEYNGEAHELGAVVFDVDFELELEDKIYVEWKEFPVPELFKYYKVMYSDSNSNVKYPDQGAVRVLTNVHDITSNFKKSLKEGIHYFRLTVVLNNGEYLHSPIQKVVVTEDVGHYEEKEEEFNRCKIFIIRENEDIGYETFEDIKTESSCVDKFTYLTQNDDGFSCNDGVGLLEVGFRNDADEEYEVIETIECVEEVIISEDSLNGISFSSDITCSDYDCFIENIELENNVVLNIDTELNIFGLIISSNSNQYFNKVQEGYYAYKSNTVDFSLELSEELLLELQNQTEYQNLTLDEIQEKYISDPETVEIVEYTTGIVQLCGFSEKEYFIDVLERWKLGSFSTSDWNFAICLIE